jgi:hypothetical protein
VPSERVKCHGVRRMEVLRLLSTCIPSGVRLL